MTPHEKEENVMWKGYYEALVTSGDSLRVMLPNETFSDKMIIHGNNFLVQLISYGIAHTESDLFLYLPNQQIAFLGDTLFIHNQPWFGDGDPDKWSDYLDKIIKLQPRILIPGHGPAGDLHDIDSMKLYFKTVKNAAASYYRRKILPEKDTALKSPSPFNNWFLSVFYRPNVIYEYHRLYDKK